MSRTLTLSGVTLWDNGTTGLGTVTPEIVPTQPDRMLTRLPRTRTHLVKEIGGTGVIVRVGCQYSLTKIQHDSLLIAINTAFGQQGSLTLPDGRTWSNVILTNVRDFSSGYERLNAGGITQRVTVGYEFFQVRV